MTKKPSKNAAREIRIVYMRLDKIQRDPENPKGHNLPKLAEAFERFGFVAPMGMNETTKYLLWGHGRLDKLFEAMIAGEAPPDGIKASRDGMWRAPVVRGIHLKVEDGSAYVVADNRLVELGGWDDPKLAQRLVEAAGGDALEGLKGTGFEEADVDALVAKVGGSQNLFDAGTLDDTPVVPAGDTKAYVIAIVYMSFEEEDTFNRGLMALTFGERKVQRENAKYAQVDGERYLLRWEEAVKVLEKMKA